MTHHDLRESIDPEALAGTWALLPGVSNLRWRTRAMWILPVRGSFQFAEGLVRFAGGSSSGRVTVAATSVASGIGKRDAHLRSADFFDAHVHPTIRFEFTDARPISATAWSVSGPLSIRGHTQQITFQADIVVDGDRTVVTANKVTLDRTDWGVGRHARGIPDVVHLQAEVIFVRTGTPPATQPQRAASAAVGEEVPRNGSPQ